MKRVNISLELLSYIYLRSLKGFSIKAQIIVKIKPIIPWYIRIKKGLLKSNTIIYFSLTSSKAIEIWLRIINKIAKVKSLMVTILSKSWKNIQNLLI